MSTIGTPIRENRVSQLITNTNGEQLIPMVEPSPANTPYWLLWSTGVVAFVLCVVAFVLWGVTGTRTLFDMIVALCT